MVRNLRSELDLPRIIGRPEPDLWRVIITVTTCHFLTYPHANLHAVTPWPELAFSIEGWDNRMPMRHDHASMNGHLLRWRMGPMRANLQRLLACLHPSSSRLVAWAGLGGSQADRYFVPMERNHCYS
jgi:hypothetical protein